MDRVADYSNLLCDFLSHLRFGIEADDTLARLTDVCEDKFQKITLALTAVAENEDIACSFVLGSAVEVHKDVCTVFISADI